MTDACGCSSDDRATAFMAAQWKPGEGRRDLTRIGEPLEVADINRRALQPVCDLRQREADRPRSSERMSAQCVTRCQSDTHTCPPGPPGHRHVRRLQAERATAEQSDPACRSRHSHHIGTPRLGGQRSAYASDEARSGGIEVGASASQSIEHHRRERRGRGRSSFRASPWRRISS